MKTRTSSYDQFTEQFDNLIFLSQPLSGVSSLFSDISSIS